MVLVDSPLSSVKLREKPERFLTLLGVSIEQFDAMYTKLSEHELLQQQGSHPLWRQERVERMVGKSAEVLREYLCITLLYIRQYNIQEVLAASFDISQAQVSKIVSRISESLEKILPVPARAVSAVAQRLEQIDETIRKDYSATLIIDASEQRIERSQDQEQQRQDYSGKKKCHSRKFQVIITQSGLILDLSNAIKGSVHDFRIFKERLLNKPLKRMLHLLKSVIVWADSAYEALPEYFPEWRCRVNEKAKRNHPLTQQQKDRNRWKSKTRILVEHTISRIKKYRTCSDRVRNMTSNKQTRYWNIVAGLCNLRKATELNIQDLFGYSDLVRSKSKHAIFLDRKRTTEYPFFKLNSIFGNQVKPVLSNYSRLVCNHLLMPHM